jgi:diacyltrehalose acyltransferase
MTQWKARGLGAGLLTGACLGLLDFASMLNAAPALADSDSADYTALVLGHAFLAQPDAAYMQQVIDTYVDNPIDFHQPMYTIVGDPVGVYTPETDYGPGLTQGVTDLDHAITAQLEANPDAHLVIAGYSMSPSVVTQEMINLDAAGAPDADGLKFVLAEDLNNPDGGIFTRFPGMFGVNLPATPADTPYDTSIYTIEYSGASDFPQYYGNLYADLNAVDGYADLHPYLLPGWPAYFDPSTVVNAVAENTSEGYTGNTDYFLIPTQDLPLLDGLHAIGGSSPFADLIEPDLRVLVDLGYDWTGGADVNTVATLSNPDIDFAAVNDYLEAGANQGMIAALVDLGILPQSDLADLANLYPYVPDVAGLMEGALTDQDAAALDASTSLAALMSDLSESTNPLVVEFGSYLPGMAGELAGYFQSLASFL